MLLFDFGANECVFSCDSAVVAWKIDEHKQKQKQKVCNDVAQLSVGSAGLVYHTHANSLYDENDAANQQELCARSVKLLPKHRLFAQTLNFWSPGTNQCVSVEILVTSLTFPTPAASLVAGVPDGVPHDGRGGVVPQRAHRRRRVALSRAGASVHLRRRMRSATRVSRRDRTTRTRTHGCLVVSGSI